MKDFIFTDWVLTCSQLHKVSSGQEREGNNKDLREDDQMSEIFFSGTNCTGFKCRNGQCKEPEQRCDGIMDCMDNSDEENCGNFFECFINPYQNFGHNTWVRPQEQEFLALPVF